MASSVTVLGAGSWGTALAIHLARLGHPVSLWGRSAALAGRLRDAGEHADCHPGVAFPEGLSPTADLSDAVGGAKAVVMSCPSHAMHGLAEQVRPLLDDDALLVSTAKGIEQDTHRTMSAILEAALPEHRTRVSVLSGPSFAREVARGMPTAVTAAASDLGVAEELQHLFTGPTLRVYTSTDVVGVEIGGAVKNVIALAAGVSDGLGFGYNTRAALITRGLAEISRLAIELGADPRTALRPLLPGRPGLDLHRRPVTEPQRRASPRPRREAGRRHREHERGRGRCPQHRFCAQPRPERWVSRCR